MSSPNFDPTGSDTNPLGSDAPESTDPDEELVAQCLDLFLTQLGTADAAAEPSTLELSASPRVRERIERAKECVEVLESLAATTLNNSSINGQRRSSAQAKPAPQKRIGRFHVLGELGSGGFGIVYLAWDPRTDRQVALKIPRIEMLASTELEQRFEQEARAAARLDHPHIVSVLEAGSDGMLPYIASVYYPGVTLATWLREHREPLEPMVVARFIQQLAQALAHAHAHGVLHRDIKPSNILLAPTDATATTEFALDEATPRLMDFGLAKLADAAGDMTRTGAMLGTIRYMPPEQAAGRTKEIGPASDVYGLGMVLYELLAGEPPFTADTDIEVLRKISTEEPSRIRHLRPTTPLDLETIALKCLEKEPARRYATAAALADDLGRFLRGEPILARPASPVERVVKWCRRNPQLAAFVGIAATAMLGFMAFLIWSNARLSDSLRQTALERTRAEQQSKLAVEREQVAREYAYGSDIRLAQEAWERSTPEEALELLERHVPRKGQTDLRHIEWQYLWSSMHRYSQIVANQRSPIWSLSASPSSELFATGDREGVVRLWSIEPPKLVRELRGHGPGDINCLLFTPDGKTLITASDDQAIRFWNVSDGTSLDVFNEHKAWVGALAISQSGTWLASGDAEGRVLLWNLDKHELVRELYRHGGSVRRILFRPGINDSWLVSASEDGDVRVWDFLENKPPEKASTGNLETPPDSFIRHAVFHGDGNWLCAASHGNLLIWDFRPGHDCQKLADHIDAPGTFSLAIDGNGKYLLAGGDDAHPDIFVRRLDKIEELARVLHGHSDLVRDLAPLADINTFLSGSEDGTVRKWQLNLSDPNAVRHSLGSTADALAWSADGKSLFVGLHSGELRVFAAPFDREPTSLGRQASAIRGIAVSADKRLIISVDDEGEVKRWRLDLQPQAESFRIGAEVDHIKLMASDQLLVYARKQSLAAVDARTGQEQWRFDHSERIWALEKLDDTLVASYNDGVVRCFDAATGRILRQTPAQRTAVRTIAFARDGRRMVTGSADKTIRIYDARTFAEQVKFSHAEGMARVFYIDDDQRLLVCEANYLALVNPATGQTMLKIPNQQHPEAIAAVNPSGSILAAPQVNDLLLLSLTFQ